MLSFMVLIIRETVYPVTLFTCGFPAIQTIEQSAVDEGGFAEHLQ